MNKVRQILACIIHFFRSQIFGFSLVKNGPNNVVKPGDIVEIRVKIRMGEKDLLFIPTAFFVERVDGDDLIGHVTLDCSTKITGMSGMLADLYYSYTRSLTGVKRREAFRILNAYFDVNG